MSRPRVLGCVAAMGIVVLTGCEPGSLSTEAAPSPSPSPTASVSPASSPIATLEPVTISMSAMGDWLPHDSVVEDARVDGGYDFAHFFQDLQPRYRDSDLVYCNDEVPLAGDVMGLSFYPAFNAPAAMATGMVEAGCTTISLANNHLADHGQQGIDITREVWDAAGALQVSGANRSPEEQQELAITTIDGIDIAFLSFTAISNAGAAPWALNRLDDVDLVEGLMERARAESDVQIVAAHWGDEYSTEVNDDQRAQAQWLANLGADIILGAHPHVLQPAEWVERDDGTRAFAYFSLGNALSTQMAVPRLLAAVAQFDLLVHGDGTVTVENPSAIPIYMHFDLTPAQYEADQWYERKNLLVLPLVDAADAIARSAWVGQLTVESGMEFVTDVLGPDVTITP